MIALRRSPLHDKHVDLGAKLADFGGWEMPIEYSGSGGGVIAEHTAVRTAVGIFDVSHLGKCTVRGAGAAAFVNSCLTADLGRLTPGQAQYTLCCAPDGGVVDDIFSYLVGPDEVFLMPNAANATEVIRLLTQAAAATQSAAAAQARPATGALEVRDQHEDFVVLAVQGPRSGQVLTDLQLPADVPYLTFLDTTFDAREVRVCRTGYTGELGYELIVPSADAARLWDALTETARSYGGMPAGLGARDTLRTEMGYPLHGQDLSREITPVQAGSGWAVGWAKPAFWGREALLAERKVGPTRRLRGLLCSDRGVPRAHMAIRTSDGSIVGQTTSGTFSPTLKRGIALALIDTSADVADGAEVQIDVRGRLLTAEVRTPPFVASHVR